MVNHYTVDVYRKEYQESTTLDRPIGVVHVYEKLWFKSFQTTTKQGSGRKLISHPPAYNTGANYFIVLQAYKAAASATSETGTNATTS